MNSTSSIKLAKTRLAVAEALLLGAKRGLGLVSEKEMKNRINHLTSSIKEQKSLLTIQREIHFSIGSPTNTYTVFRGNFYECEDYLWNLPSENDAGWGDAWEGMNPFREACRID